MPAEAGIQPAGNLNNYKALDFRFFGNDGVFPHCDTEDVKKSKYSPLTLPTAEAINAYLKAISK